VIYLDNAATTRPDPEAIQEMLQFLEQYIGNASSIHKEGIYAIKGIEKVREIISSKINSKPNEIIFTSGGTESNNFAIKGIALEFYEKRDSKNHIITSQVEHPSVYNVTGWLSKLGYKVDYLPVDGEGFVDPSDVKKMINDKTILVSVIHANNEIGTIEPILEIGNICREKGVYFHTDACQSFTKVDLDVVNQYLDLVSLNAHKIHGPKGVGALYIRESIKITPLLHGGGQENDLRSGTYNTPGIAGFGAAVEKTDKRDSTRMKKMRSYFIDKVLNTFDGVKLNGPDGAKRLCNNINLSFVGIEGKEIFRELNSRGIMVSTGSACRSTKLVQSNVLTAIGQSHKDANSAIRISLSKWTTKKELDITFTNLIEIIPKLRDNSIQKAKKSKQ
jgi:cysteine desulfurase